MKKTAEHLIKVDPKNTMTDWHSVTDCVYNLLEQWKTEIGKVANDSLNEMNENEQKIFTSITGAEAT